MAVDANDVNGGYANDGDDVNDTNYKIVTTDTFSPSYFIYY